MTAQTDETQAAATPEFGRARLRKEDERLITGQTNWTDNIQLSLASSPPTPAPISPTSRAACPAPGRSPRTS